MGVIGAVIEFLIGLWVIGTALVFTEPIFDMTYQMAVMFGMQTNPTIQFIYTTMDYILILVGLLLALHALASAGERETAGTY
jgi:hypothetical protein